MDTTRQTNDQDLVRTLVAQIFDRVMAVQHLQQPIDLTSSPFKEPALKKRKKGMEGEEKASWSAFPGEITDRLFGTRAYTEGARFQIPRKIPLRIEPKTYFANERTFLSWLSMAVTLGSVGTAIAGFAVEDEDSPGQHKGGISQSTVQLMTLTMLPISICMIAYALFTFYWRSEFIRKKQIGFFDDKIGPVTVALVVEVALLIIMFSAIRDVLFY